MRLQRASCFEEDLRSGTGSMVVPRRVAFRVEGSEPVQKLTFY